MTETELVNSALRKIGGKRITSIDEAVGSAGIASDILTNERDELLASTTWNFAVTRAALAALSVAPIFEFDYAFALPSDCLRLISVTDNDGGTGAVEYKLESVEQADASFVTCILTAVSQVWIRYVRKVTDVSLMSPGFREVLILRMAKIFAISIARSNPLYQGIDAELTRALSSAKSADSMQDYPDRMQEGSWATSRRRYGWSRNADWPR